MRTTIEIPEELRHRLVHEASVRHKKGFSEIIVEALEQYFRFGEDKRKTMIKKLQGCLNEDEYSKEKKRLKEGRDNWRG